MSLERQQQCDLTIARVVFYSKKKFTKTKCCDPGYAAAVVLELIVHISGGVSADTAWCQFLLIAHQCGHCGR